MRPGEGGEDGEEWGSAKAMCRRNSVRSGSAVFPDRSFDHFIVQQSKLASLYIHSPVYIHTYTHAHRHTHTHTHVPAITILSFANDKCLNYYYYYYYHYYHYYYYYYYY
jgi:hypothetical protein